MKELAKRFKKAKIDTVIVISPHAPTSYEHFNINASEKMESGLQQIGDFETKLEFETDKDFVKKLAEAVKNAGRFKLEQIQSPILDYGTVVPLYYLSKNSPKIKTVSLSFSMIGLKEHFEYGKIIGNVCEKLNKKIALIASGDLSHRLTPEAPAGFSKRGKEFDKKLAELLNNKDTQGILNLDENLIEEAGECGLRSITILLGALDGKNYKIDIISYEGPFGVGYLVAELNLMNF
ncbi:MAG: Extradiol ring-cleavage dioxygenase class III protein subunit B [uncultured bacterium]|nr:MAG: Extradiol ring-cleavage dioxygenase class III protein subunit B [uncultured bacterium]